MAVFTELTDQDQNNIAEAYGLKGLSSVIGIADGDTETTYLFRCVSGEFIVTIFENGAEPQDLDRAFQTMELLSERGVPCPRPLRAPDGQATIRYSGKLVATVSFLSGSPSGFAKAVQCFDLGGRTAQIHRILGRIRTPRAGDKLTRGQVHGALFPENVFFLNEKVSGIINFRLRHDDILISELAEVLVRWTGQPENGLDLPRAQSLLDGYCSERPLGREEMKAFPGFVLAAAARQFAGQQPDQRLPQIASQFHDDALQLKFHTVES